MRFVSALLGLLVFGSCTSKKNADVMVTTLDSTQEKRLFEIVPEKQFLYFLKNRNRMNFGQLGFIGDTIKKMVFIFYREAGDKATLYFPDTIIYSIPRRFIDASGEEIERMSLYAGNVFVGNMIIITDHRYVKYSYYLYIDWESLKTGEGYSRFYLKDLDGGYSVLMPKYDDFGY